MPELNLKNALLGKDNNFIHNKIIVFQNIKFNENLIVDLENFKLQYEVTFFNCCFEKDIELKNIKSNHRFSYRICLFKGSVNINNVDIHDFEFTSSNIKKLELTNGNYNIFQLEDSNLGELFIKSGKFGALYMLGRLQGVGKGNTQCKRLIIQGNELLSGYFSIQKQEIDKIVLRNIKLNIIIGLFDVKTNNLFVYP